MTFERKSGLNVALVACQVLRDEIGTAVRQIKSRADQFSLIMHGQEGEGEDMEGFLRKECAQVCGTHPVCPSLILGFSVLQMVLHGASSRKSLILGSPVLQVVLQSQI